MYDSKPQRIASAPVGDGDADLVWCVDTPTDWMLSCSQVLVSGWCFSRGGPLTGVRAVLARPQRPQPGEYGKPRPDVQQEYPALIDDRVGFDLPLTLPRGGSLVRIEVERGDRWVPLCRIRASVRLGDESNFTYNEYLREEAGRLLRIAAAAVREAQSYPMPPFISVVMPVFNPALSVLNAAIASVRNQMWPHWELVAVDDGSTDRAVLAVLDEAAATDERIRVLKRARNGGISRATNDGFASARGEWIALLDHDDMLSPCALALVAREACANPQADLIYTDQDKIDAGGRRSEPFFKPDWSPLWLRGVMYLGHLLVVRRSLIESSGGCDPRFDGVQDFELALRLSERARKVVHVPQVLYHWRMVEGSIAANGAAKPNIDKLQAKAVQESLERLGIPARAEATPPRHRVRLVPAIRGGHPLVSIMIPTRDRPELISRCLESLYARTAYSAFEVIIGDNETVDPEALRAIEKHPVRRVPLPGPFHCSRFNNLMAAEARGEFILLLNNDTEVVTQDWLDHLVVHASLPDVGAIGPELVYADGTVQHAGLVLGPHGTADHVMRGFPAGGDGYFGSLACAREVSALTGACLLVRAQLYRQLGGLCEHFRHHYEDVDFCLRLRARGMRNILVAGTRLIHHESRTRGTHYDYTDRVLLLDRWEQEILRGDPYHSRHFGNDLYYSICSAGLQL